MTTARRFAFGAGALLVAGLAAAAIAREAPAPAQKPKARARRDEIAAALDRLVPELLKDGDVPGLSLAIVRDGRIELQRAYGVKDAASGTPVDADTVFEAASLSKPVFAYAVLKIVDAGKLDLDAPPSKYLPGDYVEDPRQSAITARRVLSHTSGFPNWRPTGQPLKIHFAPGERFSYSGEGFVYLQKAVERLTGQTLDAVMKRLVFEPLHMASSSYVWEDRYERRKATGHDAAGTPRPLRRPAEAFSAASLHTTAGDYARFLAAALDGSGLQARTAAEMIRPQVHVDEGCQNCITTKPTGRLSRELAGGLGWGSAEDGISLWHWDNGGSDSIATSRASPPEARVVVSSNASAPGDLPDRRRGDRRTPSGSPGSTTAVQLPRGPGSRRSSRAGRAPSSDGTDSDQQQVK
jgi:CubicO group peptidase (beta-lactamase class C family)